MILVSCSEELVDISIDVLAPDLLSTAKTTDPKVAEVLVDIRFAQYEVSRRNSSHDFCVCSDSIT